ncbi:hypothetical protein EJ06DRAFT_66004 [Trichodelitschia bisporula]|uniref:Uncharacterized protein n=1 Tax=Trichodelitschia bisporula TaxID=703511 RepID=A0A6G1HTG1_9PEZI|nr:hypothetical protein EJ06DRAFT_66004 [Trichodelitschia bisporula]
MKYSSFLFAASAAAAALDMQQGACKLPSPGSPQIRATAQRKFYSVGTYTLKGNPNGAAAAAGGSHSHGGSGGGMGGMMGEGDAQSFAASPSGSTFCGTCTVLAGQIKIFYPDGSPANVSNGIYVHHILTNGIGSQPAFVRSGLGGLSGAMGAGFVGAGDDNGNRPWVYAPKDGSFESGFQIAPTTRFSAQIVLVNYNKVPKTVCVAYDLEFIPGHVGKKVKSSLISAAGMTGPKVDRGRAVNTTSSPMAFSEPGYIILAKGHLHDGGSAMYMRISGKNSYSCVSRATYGHTVGGEGGQATISDMSDCNSKPWRIESGDSMTMTAEYDLKSHPLRGTASGGEAGVMGMFRIIFAPDKAW